MASPADSTVFKDLDQALSNPEKVGVLELFRLKLPSLPAEIGLLKKMHTLKVYDCSLEELSPEIRLCGSLEHLELGCNRLEHLPVYVCALPRLRSLLLYNNRIAEIPPEIGHMRSLEDLGLNINRLKTLPAQIGCLENLLSLDLAENPFEALPGEIGALARLKKLRISDAKLARLPEEIGYCAALEELDLHSNQIAELPLMLGRLANLRVLWLLGNRLERIGPEIGELTKLRQLGFSKNSLKELPPEMGKLSRVEHFAADGNKLERLPPQIASMVSLQKLELGENALTELPPEMGRLARLNTLDLAKNRLKTLPKELAQIPGPLHVDLSDNPLERLPEELFVSGALRIHQKGPFLPHFQDGLGRFAEAAALGERERLSRVWVEGEGVTARLWPRLEARARWAAPKGVPVGPENFPASWPDLSLIWIGPKDGKSYGVLYEIPELSEDLKNDPDFEPMHLHRQYLVCFEDRGYVRPVLGKERASLEAYVRALPRMSAEALRSKAKELLGSLEERGSAGWFEAGRKERGLRPGLRVKNASMPAGAIATVLQTRRPHAKVLQVSLSAPGEVAADEYRVVHVLQRGVETFLALRSCTDTVVTDAPPECFVIRVVPKGLEVLDEKALAAVCKAILEQLEQTPRTCVDLGDVEPFALDRLEPVLREAIARGRFSVDLCIPYLMTKPFDPETGQERHAVGKPGDRLRLARAWIEQGRVHVIFCKWDEAPFVPEGRAFWDLRVEHLLADPAGLCLMLRYRPEHAPKFGDPRFMVRLKSLERALALTVKEYAELDDRCFELSKKPAVSVAEVAAALLAMPKEPVGLQTELRLAPPPPTPPKPAPTNPMLAETDPGLPAPAKPGPHVREVEPFRPLWLVGERFAGGTLARFLSASAFAAVYDAERAADKGRFALKIARPPGSKVDWSHPPGSKDVPAGKLEESPGWVAPTTLRTQARTFMTGGTCEIEVNAGLLLFKQAQRLRAAADPAVVKVGPFLDDGRYCQLVMEYVEGRTLRSLVGGGRPASLVPILELARAMDRLLKLPGFPYHGDLKPDNVLHSAGRITIIDPGYFGPIESAYGHEIHNAFITTPDYYPFLQPDDLFAAGIMLWEAATGMHPLGNGPSSSERADLKRIGEKLREIVRMPERVGQYFLSPLLDLRPPREICPSLKPELEAVLLKALRLELRKDGVIDAAEGYASFAELAEALEPLV
ncbi:MAG: serine/threonine-protein kinase [Planctomycetes bacterium]|nr:serine/threonine-protein kinase [Planctomycetota bacterium]